MKYVLDLAGSVADKPSGDIPVAAIIVKSGEIIAEAVNTRELKQSIIAHAEINAMQAAAEKLNDWNLSSSTLYVNLEPCVMCTGAILQSHISQVVFAAYEPKSGALGSRYNLATKNLDVIGGVLEKESQLLLSKFFKKLREA